MSLSMVSIIENAAEKALNSGRMIAFYLPQHTAKYIQSLFDDVSGDMVHPEDMHITLGLVQNGDNSKILKVLSKISPSIPPIPALINQFDVFEPNINSENKYILHAKPECEPIFEVHDKVFDALKQEGVEVDNGHFNFKPHITIKYCTEKPNIEIPIKEKIILDKIYLAQGKKRKGFKLSP